MVRLLARIVGIGVETADMLVHEVLSRPMRDRRAVARYAGLTGTPDESGARRREQGLSRAGNARVRRGMIQLGWRFLMFQKESALALWYRARTADSRIGTRKTMIVKRQRHIGLTENDGAGAFRRCTTSASTSAFQPLYCRSVHFRLAFGHVHIEPRRIGACRRSKLLRGLIV
jgi:Transposase IS116/IS110/IS902 family